MASEAKMEHNRALLRGNMEQAKSCVEQLAAVDESEAEYRQAMHAGWNTALSLATVLVNGFSKYCKSVCQHWKFKGWLIYLKFLIH